MPKYNNPFSVDYRTPVYIDSSDPRAKKGEYEKNVARYGRKIKIVENKPSIVLDKYVPAPPTFLSFLTGVNTEGNSIVIDNEGNSYAIIIDYRGFDYQQMYYLVKFDLSGNVVWEIRIDDMGYDENLIEWFEPIKLSIDSNNNLYFVASHNRFSFDARPDEDFLVVTKINSGGTVLWYKSLKDSAYFTDHTFDGGAIKTVYSNVDSNSNLYIVANIEEKSTNKVHVLAMKLDSEGNTLWQKVIKKTTSTYDGEFARSAKIDSNGYLYIVYSFSYESLISKISPSGNIEWVKKINSSLAETAEITDTVIDSDNNIYLSTMAYSGGYYNTIKIYILKIDSSGNTIWQKRYKTNLGFINLYWWPTMSYSAGAGLYLLVPGYFEYGGYEILKINNDGTIDSQKKLNPAYKTSPNFSTSLIYILESKTNSSSIYFTGFTNINSNETAYICKLPKDLPSNYTITCSGIPTYNDLFYPDDPTPIDFIINITTPSNTDTTVSVLSLSNFTNYSTSSTSFSLVTNMTLITKNIPVELLKSKGKF